MANRYAVVILCLYLLLRQGYSMRSIGIKVPIPACMAAEAHNFFRRQHISTEDLEGDQTLTDTASSCAMKLLNTNRKTKCDLPSDVTQNIAVLNKQTQKEDIKNIVTKWYSSLNTIRFNDSISFVHFPINKVKNAVRIIWTTTSKVGCGAATSVGITPETIYVCNYSPGARYEGLGSMDIVKFVQLRKPRPKSGDKIFDGHCKDINSDYCKSLHKMSMQGVKDLCMTSGFAKDYCKLTCNICRSDKKD